MKNFYVITLLFIAIACTSNEDLEILEEQSKTPLVIANRTPICDVEEQVVLTYNDVADIVGTPYFEFEFFILAYHKLADENEEYWFLRNFGLWHCNRTGVSQPTPDTYEMTLWFSSSRIDSYNN